MRLDSLAYNNHHQGVLGIYYYFREMVYPYTSQRFKDDKELKFEELPDQVCDVRESTHILIDSLGVKVVASPALSPIACVQQERHESIVVVSPDVGDENIEARFKCS